MSASHNWPYQFSENEWDACIKVLHVLKNNPNDLPNPDLLKGLVSNVHKAARKQKRKQAALLHKQNDALMKQQTYMFHYQTGQVHEFTIHTHATLVLHKASKCYACGDTFHELSPIYHKLCPACTRLHITKRQQTANLHNRVAIITGGRIKVGFATALKLLRDGATVIVTSRFPNDALAAYAAEKDFERWKNRLILYGLDLRSIKNIEAFISFVYNHFDTLDILINNAAQTIQYDSDYYNRLVEREKEYTSLANTHQNIIQHPFDLLGHDATLALPGLSEITPTDIFNQPLDKRTSNSWTATLSDIDTAELLEVNLINNIAPFILNSRLKPLMEKSSFEDRFIINVTSSEGQFSYKGKTIFHPHTNMTKAALNMMTLTSAKDYALSGILMNSVDVGWVSTGMPLEKKEKLKYSGYIMPLDIYDAAARIYDPIATTINTGLKQYGMLYKNFKSVAW